jgi:hypothetical protein
MLQRTGDVQRRQRLATLYARFIYLVEEEAELGLGDGGINVAVVNCSART